MALKKTFQQKGQFYTDEQTAMTGGSTTQSLDKSLSSAYVAWTGTEADVDPSQGYRSRMPAPGKQTNQLEQMQTQGEQANTRAGEGEIDKAAKEAYKALQ